MDLSQYAELFLAESREHLGACNQLLLEWERKPQATEPVGGIFRAVHTVKGMAATMGYARVAELSHRMENLLDLLRRGGRKPTDDLLQLLFRATDALERAIDLSVAGRDREADVAGIAAELDAAAQRFAPADAKAAKAAAVAAPPPPTEPPAGGRAWRDPAARELRGRRLRRPLRPPPGERGGGRGHREGAAGRGRRRDGG